MATQTKRSPHRSSKSKRRSRRAPRKTAKPISSLLRPDIVPTVSQTIEQVLIQGDLSPLKPEERVGYYKAVCKSLGLNPLTSPFGYILFKESETAPAKLALYAKKDAAEQLRKIHRVSVIPKTTTQEVTEDFATTRLSLMDRTGRTDTATGIVYLWKKDNNQSYRLTGQRLADAIMKSECVPLNSEILTQRGWRHYDELEIGEAVLAYDCRKDSCRWVPLLEVSVYKGVPVSRMFSDRGQFEVVCTPNHSWAIRKQPYVQRSQNPRGPYTNRSEAVSLVEAANIKTSHRLILSARYTGPTDDVLSPIEAAILGWAVTDGTINKYGRIGICQSKEENFEEIRQIVHSFCGEVKETVTKGGAHTFAPTGRTYETRDQHWWYLPAVLSRTLLQKAGFETRKDLPSLATRLRRDARVAMLQAFMLAEGDKRFIFANTDRTIMDTFQILATLEGCALGKERQRPAVMTQRLKLTKHVAGSFLNIEPYGVSDVWCPTTELGTWVMRQNGRIAITGNTKAKRRGTLSICGLGILDEMDLESVRVVGGVTPDGRIYQFEPPAEPGEAPPERQLSETAAHGHPEGSERAKQAEAALKRVEEADKALESPQTPSKNVQAQPRQPEKKSSKAKPAPPEQPNAEVPKAKAVPPMEFKGSIEIDCTVPWPIVRGDLQDIVVGLQEHFKDDFKWDMEWWHLAPKRVSEMVDLLSQNGFKVDVKIKTPSQSSAGQKSAMTSPPAEAAGSGAGSGRDQSAAPAVVSGTVDRVQPSSDASRAVVTLVTKDSKKPGWTCFDKDIYGILTKHLGEVAEVILQTRVSKGKSYTNLVGLKRVGSIEFDADGKTPIVQQRDREAGARTLFP